MNRTPSLAIRYIACVALCLAVYALDPAARAADSRPHDGLYAAQRVFGEWDRSAGWCDNATTTPANIWDSTNVPAEVASTNEGLENRRAIRQVVVQHMDNLNTTRPMCVRLGPNTGTLPTRSALTCTGTAGAEQTNGTLLAKTFAGVKWTNEEIATSASPAVYVVSSSSTVRYCVTVFWKS